MTERRHLVVASFAAIALILGAYANFFHNGFHFDDEHVIVDNASIRSLTNVPRFFTDAYTFSSLPSNSTYRPLVTLSFALDYAVHHSLDPVPFHATQLALLLIVSLLLALFLRELFGAEHTTLAIGASALFAVHTANTETLNFLSSRSELLSAIGFLGALILFARYPAMRRYGLYLIPLALAALAKAPVVIFALVAFAWGRLIERRPLREAAIAAVPPLVTGGVLLVLLNAMNAREWIAGGGSRLAYLLTQPYVWLHYARLALIPAGLTADTDLDLVGHWYDTDAIAGFVFVAMLCYAIIRLARTRERAPIAFGLAWFAITLLPTSSIFPLAEVANEHRLFFPLMGAAAAAAWSVELLARRWPAHAVPAYCALGVAAVLLAYGTYERNRVWRTEETLWRDVTVKSPRNGRGWMNYGLTQMEQGKYTVADASFERAAQLTPNYSTLEINRGIVADALGRHADAERFLRRALELSPDRNSHFYYARWLLRRGRGAEAQEHLAAASSLAPRWIQPRRLALEVAIARGDVVHARASAAEIRGIDPGDESLSQRCTTYRDCFDAAWKATNGNEQVTAAVLYRAALAYDARSANAWNNLGWSLASIGFTADAATAYRTALLIEPGFDRARANLALIESK